MKFCFKPGHRFVASMLLVSLSLFSLASSAYPGDIDTGFGKNGLLQAPEQPGHADTQALDVLQLADGHYLTINTHKNGQFSQLGLQRFAADGSWDASYTNQLPMSLGDVFGYAGAKFLANGKIIVIFNAAEGIELLRLNGDGSRDESFGYRGLKQLVLLNQEYWFEYANDFAVLPDDSIVVAVIADGITRSPGVMMMDANGDVDSHFGNQGLFVYLENGVVVPAAVAVDSHMRVLLSFSGYFDGGTKILRILPDGQGLDPAFGKRGISLLGLESGFSLDAKTNILVQPDDKIVVSTSGYDQITFEYTGYVARLNADGHKDRGFNGSGLAKVKLPKDAYQTTITSIALHNGKLLMAGSSSTSFEGERQFIEQLNSDGSLDTGFSTNGHYLKAQQKRIMSIKKISALQDGGILAAAQSRYLSDKYDTPADMALMRFTDHGQLDSQFGTDGQIIIKKTGLQVQSWNAMAQMGDGRILVAGEITDGKSSYRKNVLLARYLADGSLDQSFGEKASGFSNFGVEGFNIDIGALVIQSDNKILTCGTLHGEINGHYGTEILVLRFNTDGSLDDSFFEHGMAKIDFAPLHPLQTSELNQQCTAIRDLGQGRIGFAGQTQVHSHIGIDSFYYHREALLGVLYADNTIKNALVFGKDLGHNFTELTGRDMVLADDSHVLMSAVGLHGYELPVELVIAKFDIGHLTLDSSYGTEGFTSKVIGNSDSLDAGQLLKQADGKVIALATTNSIPETSKNKASAFRFSSYGSIDNSFANSGVFSDTYLDPDWLNNSHLGGFTNDGKIMLLSSVSVYYSVAKHFGLMRVNKDGLLDYSFGNNGKQVADDSYGHQDVPKAFLQLQDGAFLVAGSCDGIACILRYKGNSTGSLSRASTPSIAHSHEQQQQVSNALTPEKQRMVQCLQEKYRVRFDSLSQTGKRISTMTTSRNGTETNNECLNRK